MEPRQGRTPRHGRASQGAYPVPGKSGSLDRASQGRAPRQVALVWQGKAGRLGRAGQVKAPTQGKAEDLYIAG
jgi:hypothetical protein